ncbi:MAG: peroxiredoxin [Pararhodobacter sp.]|nr:peroxiredoxin [Pararhodobacter sp.]
MQPGDQAPDFTAPATGTPDGGDTLTLSALRPKKVVLYFYPKDDTSGCTKEAQGFTDQADAFAAAGAVVVGVSKDSLTKHEKFVAKYNLGVTLVSDADSDICERYGTWVEKSMYGKKFMGIERSTFLIDDQGQIVQAWHKVKVPGHVDAVLAAVQAL